MKKITGILFTLALFNFAPASFGQGYIYGINKEHKFDQLDGNTTIDQSPDTYRFNAFIAGSGQDANTPASVIYITTPSSANYSLAFSSNNQWEFTSDFGNQSAMDTVYNDGTYGFTVGGNTGFILVSGNLYPNTPIGTVSGGTWLNGTLYVTPGANLTVTSNLFTTNFVSGQSRVAIEVDGQNTGLNFDYDSLNDSTPLTANMGNVTVPGTALLSGNIYSVDIEFNAFSQFQNPGIDGGTNVGLYTATTHFTIVAGSVPVPEPSEYAMLIGVAGLGAAYWRRRRTRV